MLQVQFTCYRSSLHVTGPVYMLQVQFTCYRSSLHVTGTVYMLQVQFTCYRSSLHVTGPVYMLQVQFTCYRYSLHVTGPVYMLQVQFTCYRYSLHVTMIRQALRKLSYLKTQNSALQPWTCSHVIDDTVPLYRMHVNSPRASPNVQPFRIEILQELMKSSNFLPLRFVTLSLLDRWVPYTICEVLSSQSPSSDVKFSWPVRALRSPAKNTSLSPIVPKNSKDFLVSLPPWIVSFYRTNFQGSHIHSQS